MEQLTVFMENKPGTLAHVLEIISEAGVNVQSVSTERANMSEIRLIVDDPEVAQQVLEKHDIPSHIVDIVVIELSNNPGELAKVASVLEESDINIDYIYGIDNGDPEKGLFALKSSVDATKLRDILQQYTLY